MLMAGVTHAGDLRQYDRWKRLCYDDFMQASDAFEAGINRTFRLFAGVRLGLAVFVLIIFILATGLAIEGSWRLLIFMLIDSVLLLAYLSLPEIQKKMKNNFLPVGIIWATLGPLVQLYLIFSLFLNAAPERAAFLLVLESTLVLFIPLVIIGWRYLFRMVLLFCGLTFLFDVLMATFEYYQANITNLSPVLGMSFVRTVLFLVVGYLVANLVKVQRNQQFHLVDANRRLAHYAATLEQLTISRERNRVARELHDVLAHTLSGVAVELEGVRAMLRVDTDQAEALLAQSLLAVREGLTETRRALQALRAAPLEDLGLALAIRSLTDSIAGQAGLNTEIQIDQEINDFPIEVQQTFYRVAQEALTNVVNHSQASRVRVCLNHHAGDLRLEIQDNGIGFDEKTIDLDQKYGLLGIRERVEMINGQLTISSKPGEGTLIVLFFSPNFAEVSIG
jgi:signal transduction histidine kinase